MQHLFDNFKHSQCTTNELLIFIDSTGSLLTSNLSGDAFLNQQIQLVSDVATTIKTLMARDKGNIFTEDKGNVDEKRDKLYRVMVRKIEDDLEMAEYNGTAAEASANLKKIVEIAPVKIRDNFSDETIQIDVFVSKVYATGGETAYSSSSAWPIFLLLEIANNEFKELVDKQNEAEGLKMTGKVRSFRTELIYRIEGILSYLERQSETLGGAHRNNALKIKEHLDSMMTGARARATRVANAEEETLTTVG